MRVIERFRREGNILHYLISSSNFIKHPDVPDPKSVLRLTALPLGPHSSLLLK